MTKLIRIGTLGALLVTSASALAQRTRGTIGTQPVVTQPSPPPPRPTPGVRGTMATPQGPMISPPKPGGLPWIVSEPRRGDSRSGSSRGDDRYGSTRGDNRYGSTRGTTGYGSRGIITTGHPSDRRPRYYSRPYTRWGVGNGCVYSCFTIGTGIRTGRFFSSFTVGYPFAVPILVPYFIVSSQESYVERADDRYVERADDRYAEEPPRAASKLIVIGGSSGGGGDALTVESVGDSVKLSWLANGRQAREVKLFVADSAQRQLATRITNPATPTATFEIATLSAPVAYAGVSVTFADGVMSTTVVPYRGGDRR
jgi:hypothetical protein